MRPLIITSVLVSISVLIASPQRSEACSPLNDWAAPPETELAYDSTKSPATPVVIEARINHFHEDSGCNGTCGDLHNLALTLEVDPSTTLVRIDFPDRPHIYAQVSSIDNGIARVYLPGYENDAVLDLTVRALDDRGYLSMPVSGQAFSDEEHGGCSATSNQSTALMVMLALLFVLVRRRGEL